MTARRFVSIADLLPVAPPEGAGTDEWLAQIRKTGEVTVALDFRRPCWHCGHAAGEGVLRDDGEGPRCCGECGAPLSFKGVDVRPVDQELDEERRRSASLICFTCRARGIEGELGVPESTGEKGLGQ